MSSSSRRSLITGLASLIAAPALVRAGSLMPISVEPVKLIRPAFVLYRGVDGVWAEVRSEAFVTESGAVLYRARGDAA